MDTPSTSIGPGLGAFVAFFLLAIVLWFLMRNMNERMRRIAYREHERIERLNAEEPKGEEPDFDHLNAEDAGSAVPKGGVSADAAQVAAVEAAEQTADGVLPDVAADAEPGEDPGRLLETGETDPEPGDDDARERPTGS